MAIIFYRISSIFAMGSCPSYILHHINPIYNGGGVYDLNNLVIVTPLMHQNILDPNFHFNK